MKSFAGSAFPRVLSMLVCLFCSSPMQSAYAGSMMPGPEASPQTEVVECSGYNATGIAHCAKSACFSSGDGRGLIDSQIEVTKSDEEGSERACYVELHNYLQFPGRRNPSFPRQFCIVAKAQSQNGLDRKARVRCTVKIPRFEHFFRLKDPPSSSPFDYAGKFNGVFPFSFTDNFSELTIALPFSLLESEMNAQKDGAFVFYSWSVANAHASAHQSSAFPGEIFRERFDLNMDVNLRSIVEDVDCKVKTSMSIPGSPLTAGTKVGALIQSADSTCDASGFFAHAFGLDALMSEAIRSAIASQAVGIVGTVLNEEDFTDWPLTTRSLRPCWKRVG